MKLFKGCNDGVHRFEARYDKGPCEASSDGPMTNRRLEVVEKYRRVTYVREVCVRCGKVIERSS